MAKQKHHQAVQVIADDLSSRGRTPRVVDKLSVLDTVAGEAERRGLTVDTIAKRPRDVRLRISVGDRGYEVTVRESIIHRPDGLMIWVTGPGLEWSGLKYYETKRISLFDRIPGIFDSIDAAQPVHDERERVWREQRERIASERASRLELVRLAELEAAREAKLLDAYARWTRAKDLRSYVEALDVRIAKLEGREREDAAEWVEWIRGYIERIDPVSDSLRHPSDSSSESA